jgi:hypothetical protein
MIVEQPNCGTIPVTIYERKNPGQYGAKISIFIVTLLGDFMKRYPDWIELYAIGLHLRPIQSLD